MEKIYIICSRCGINQALFRVRNKDTDSEINICEYCEFSGDELLGRLEQSEQLEQSKSDGTYGRLHIVKKSKKDSKCRECKCDIPIGSTCYNQRLNLERVPFPIQTRLCSSCAEYLIKQGTIVAK